MPHTNSKRRLGNWPHGGSKPPNKNKFKAFQKKKSHKQFEKDLTSELMAKYDTIDESAINNFSDLPLSPETFKGLKEHGYKVPTDIQKQSIGLALQGKDILGAAQTGSGKTLAFLIPVLEKLYCEKWTRIYGVGALIITPTRELAKQIYETLLEIGKYHDFSAGLIIGGKDRKFEVKRMDQCNIIICTPGRLLDHMDRNPLFDCSNMQILVLDEADRCLDMGFEKQMNQIIENLPPKRQTLLFSATQTKSVKDLARLSLKDPSYVSAHEHLEHSTPEGLKQSYVVCELKDKVSILWSFVKNHLKQKIIMFFTSCKQVKFMFEIFSKLRPGTSLMALYGTLHQMRRMDIYDNFCKKSSGVLFATDLAARGLDFPGVHWVVQADCPEDSTTYIHRVGRTARYHKGGEALLLLLPSELKMVDNLIARKIPIEKIEINPLKLNNPVKKMEAFLTSNNELKDSAQRAFVNYVKSIALMKDKEIFDVQALDTDSLAYSFGLVKPPRIRFLQRMNARNASKNSNGEPESNQLLNKISSTNSGEDSDDSGVCDNSFPEKKSSTFQASQDDSDDDFLEVKQRDHDVELPTPAEMQEIETNKSKKGKPLTKAALAKKMLKKNVLPNKKIVFTDEGDAVVKGYNEKKSQVALEYENENVGGLDLEKAKQVLKEEDRFDKQIFKEKVKAKHKEQKRKLKEAAKKKRNQDDEEQDEVDEFGDISDDDGEEPDLSWLPDPDKVYGKGDGSHEDEDENVIDHHEEQQVSDITPEINEAKQKPDKKSKKHKKKNIEDVIPVPKKKKKLIENVANDLSVNEAEELAMLLLKNKKK